MLDVEAITVQYASADRLITAVHRLSFSVSRGERVVVLGPSGCGKTTLLKAIAGFLDPVEGTIRLDDQPTRGPGPDRIMVFQEFDQLMPWKTVAGNVAFPLLVTGRFDRDEARLRALASLARVGLIDFADAYPHTLSGGMKQRVALARALALEPALLLMDEPLAALDALTRSGMQEEILRLWREARFAMLFVTHSIDEAMMMGQRILVLSARPGRIKAEFKLDPMPDGQGPQFMALRDQIQALVLAGDDPAPAPG
jgi:NitT/TauT family transport system ATP-binding protein